jgi:chorismate mutase
MNGCYAVIPPFSGTANCIRFSIPVSDMASLQIYSGMQKCLKVFIYANVTGNDGSSPVIGVIVTLLDKTIKNPYF